MIGITKQQRIEAIASVRNHRRDGISGYQQETAGLILAADPLADICDWLTDPDHGAQRQAMMRDIMTGKRLVVEYKRIACKVPDVEPDDHECVIGRGCND